MDGKRRPQQTSLEHPSLKSEKRKTQQRRWAHIIRRWKNHHGKWVQDLGVETFIKRGDTESDAEARPS